MRVLTAKDAKTHFGNLLDTVQREPILITRNNRPTAVVVSIEDLKGTHLASMFEEKEVGYDEWLDTKLSHAMQQFESNGSQGKPAEEVYASVMEKVRSRLESKNK